MPLISQPLLTTDRIKIIKKIESKKCVFDQLTELFASNPIKQNQVNKLEIFDALIAREKLGNTYIGKGIAIPRAHLEIKQPMAALLIIKSGLDVETIDDLPIKIFLAIIVPNKQRDKFSSIIKMLNLILAEEENVKIFTQTDSKEYLANYFESLLATQVLASDTMEK